MSPCLAWYGALAPSAVLTRQAPAFRPPRSVQAATRHPACNGTGEGEPGNPIPAGPDVRVIDGLRRRLPFDRPTYDTDDTKPPTRDIDTWVSVLCDGSTCSINDASSVA